MMEPAARLAKLDEFGVEGCILFVGEFVTTFGYLPQNAIGNQVLHAYNRYFDDHGASPTGTGSSQPAC